MALSKVLANWRGSISRTCFALGKASNQNIQTSELSVVFDSSICMESRWKWDGHNLSKYLFAWVFLESWIWQSLLTWSGSAAASAATSACYGPSWSVVGRMCWHWDGNNSLLPTSNQLSFNCYFRASEIWWNFQIFFFPRFFPSHKKLSTPKKNIHFHSQHLSIGASRKRGLKVDFLGVTQENGERMVGWFWMATSILYNHIYTI